LGSTKEILLLLGEYKLLKEECVMTHLGQSDAVYNVRSLQGEEVRFLGTFFSHGVRLSQIDTAAAFWPIVPAPDDRW
jgi:hypothetical protein